MRTVTLMKKRKVSHKENVIDTMSDYFEVHQKMSSFFMLGQAFSDEVKTLIG
jgi:hypothetical protein